MRPKPSVCSKTMLTFVLSLFLAVPAQSAEDIRRGSPGLPGADGIPGDPAQNGAAGGAGEDVTTTATSELTDDINIARATGGTGGLGGNGGNGFDGPDADGSADGGDGGNAGRSGNATAIASTTVDAGQARAEASANGNFAQQGGAGGLSDGAGTRGIGGRGGDGGLATARATSVALDDATSGFAEASAFGGQAGTATDGGRGGNGGSAVAEASAEALASDESAFASVRSEAEAKARSGGGPRTSSTQSGPGASGGDGGHATASALAVTAGWGTASVRAESEGGAGGDGLLLPVGRPGVSSATAYGESLGRVAVSATQIAGAGGNGIDTDGGDGADSVMNNAADGLSPLALTLEQEATGGFGGSSTRGTPGRGGNAVSSIIKNVMTDRLDGTSIANAGGGGSDNSSGDGQAAGQATASISLMGTNEIRAIARSFGGKGGGARDGTPANGGEAQLGVVYGESRSGGEVVVSGEVTGGSGGDLLGFGPRSGDGAAVSLSNAVDGYTDGALLLFQTATGGDSGRISSNFSNDPVAGSPGDAHSHLEKDGDFERLEVTSHAIGGSGDQRSSDSGIASTGAEAASSAIARNGQGSARARAIGSGGDGGEGRSGADGGQGGDGSAWSVADISNGGTEASSSASGSGGSGGRGLFRSDQAGGTGGNGYAESLAIGSAAATLVRSSAGASGGWGGNADDGENSRGGSGGDGRAIADAISESAELVWSEARAFGGDGGVSDDNSPLAAGGNATADAQANVGVGSASARAEANGGRANQSALFRERNGGLSNATATAVGYGINNFSEAESVAEGGGGHAESTAAITGGIVRRLEARSAASIAGDTTVRSSSEAYAYVAIGDGSPEAIAQSNESTTGKEAYASLLVIPDDLLFQEAVSGTISVRGALQDPSNVAMLGTLGGGYATDFAGRPTGATGEALTACASLDFSIATGLTQSELILGLLDAESFGDGFAELHLDVIAEDTVVFSESFVDLATALTFFSDNSINLGSILLNSDGVLDVSLILGIDGNKAGDAFFTDFVVSATVVPLPSVFVLLGSALALLFGVKLRVQSIARKVSTSVLMLFMLGNQSQAASYELSVLAPEFDNVAFSALRAPVIDNQGQVTFWGSARLIPSGIYRYAIGDETTKLLTSDSSQAFQLAVNDEGTVLYPASSSTFRGLAKYSDRDGSTLIAELGVPNRFDGFDILEIGSVTNNDVSVFRGRSSTQTGIYGFIDNQVVPQITSKRGDGVNIRYSRPTINSAGEIVARREDLNSPLGGEQVVKRSSDAITILAFTGMALNDSSILELGIPSIGDAGTTTFVAVLDNGEQVLLSHSESSGLVNLITTADSQFDFFLGSPQVIPNGGVLFQAGSEENGNGLYLAQERAINRIVGSGDEVDGFRVSSIFVAQDAVDDVGRLVFASVESGSSREAILLAAPVPIPIPTAIWLFASSLALVTLRRTRNEKK